MRLTLEIPPDIGTPPAAFLDGELDPTDLVTLDALCESLLARSIETADDLVEYIHHWSELSSRVEGEVARRYIRMTCDTLSEETKESYVSFEREVVSHFRTLDDRLNRKFLESSCRDDLDDRFQIFQKRRAQAAEIFRETNTPLFVRDRELATRWESIQGALTVEFRGETLTPQQCGAFLEEPDRETREGAYRAMVERRQQNCDEIDDVFDQLLEVRAQIARNAGFWSYREFRFADLCRFDYTPTDCELFHEAVELEVLPAVAELTEMRRTALGIDSVRPWDRGVSLRPTPPLKPFRNAEEYIDVTRKIFRAVDPFFENEFDILQRNDLLDLMSRPGKAPGGYNYAVEDVRVPFIFFNAVGTHSDVQTLLHEGGHAFHTLATREEPVRDYREAPIEFCEVASMAMELFGLERLEAVYGVDDAREAMRNQLMSIVEDFTWFATIDAFQHWLYTHQGHSRDERTRAWVKIFGRFHPHVDFDGLEIYRKSMWQKQGHLFGNPFYYIEYAIAQIGALQAWVSSRRDHDAAIAAYRGALQLGGSRSLPELFEAAGLRFALDRPMLGELIPQVMDRIRELG